jgi:16S rRNA U516 pseudouridylate synthase RsuA-like enzyme
MEEKERIILIGYILGIIAREANQRGDTEVTTENIEKLLDAFHAEPILTDQEHALIQFIESISLNLNLEEGTNREIRRGMLSDNKKVYKLN